MNEQKSNDKQEVKPAWWQPAIMMFARLSGWIIAPVLIATLAGRWLDNKYGTEPWMFIGVVGVAFVISIVGLVIEAGKEYAKIEKTNKKNSNKT
jgi:F0F1-type ATP synthase assembly protein I